MKTEFKKQICILAASWAAATVVSAADWPQFMGPKGDGTSPEKGLMRAWPEGGPTVLWTLPLGPGYGNAAIRDGKVYVLDRVDQKQDVLRCLDLGTGKEEWTFAYDAPGRIDHDGSRSTPSISEKQVFIVGPMGHFHCLDRATHQVVWKKNLLADYGTKSPRWAVAQSPLLYKNLVIVAPQSESVGLTAFDQATGEKRWDSKSIGAMAYASPLIFTIGGVDQCVLVNTDGATAVDPGSGNILWRYSHPCKIPAPNVSQLGNDKLFVTGAYNAGSAIIQIAREGDKWIAKETARIDQIGGHCHPGLVFQDHVYLLCNTNEKNEGMVCFDANGKILWQTKRDPNLDKGGSILTADGLIYVMDGKTGELYIVEPSPEGFKSLGKTKLLEGREIWGPLALSDGKLILRDQTQMKCLDIRKP